jgi:hypothetical protein
VVNKEKPNLLVIVGNKVYRYVNGKREPECVIMDFSVGVKYLLEHLEWYRENGMQDEN